MKNSKINKLVLLLCVFNLGCATSFFKISKESDSAIEINVTPDRIILECEHLDRDDGVISDGFMIHILNNEKKVLTVAQSNAIDPESCNERFTKITKILNQGKKIYIAGMGNLEGSNEVKAYTFHFPKFGTFPGSGMSLQFKAIANEHGTCYDAHYGDEKPCPRPPFPL